MAEVRRIAPESPDTAETLAAMRRALLRSGDRFALFVAVSNSPRRSRELIRLLDDTAPGMEVVELTAPIEDPLAAIRDRVDGDDGGPLIVLGLEHSLSTDQVDAPVLRVLNMQRERWPAALRRPVVLWVPEFVLELLGQAAPDFLDWRSDTFHFGDEEGEGGERKELQALDAAVWKGGLDEGLPLTDRRRRIEELRSRLASTEGAEDRRVRAARAGWSHELGLHLYRLDEWDGAEACFHEALDLAQAVGSRRNQAAAYHELGVVVHERGAYDQALHWYRKSLEIEEQLGDRAGMAISYHQLGMVAQSRGLDDEALDWYRKSLAISEELGDRVGIASSYHQLGMISESRGAYDEALDWFRRSIAITEELGDRVGMTTSLSQIGVLWTERGEPEKGLPFNLRSLALRLELDTPQVAIDLHWLRLQRDLLGEERFQAIVEREGTVDPDLLSRLLRKPEPEEAPQPAPATA